MSHTIDDLRAELFATIRELRNKDAPLDIDRARAVSEVAQTIIASAKVEVEFARATGQEVASGFLPTDPKPAALPNGITGVTRHKIKG
jgi:hypothetical protein